MYGLSGASSDVEMASRLARAMVTKYAMSDVVSSNTIPLTMRYIHVSPHTRFYSTNQKIYGFIFT